MSENKIENKIEDDCIEIDGMWIEGASTLIDQARHNTAVLKRLGILPDDEKESVDKPERDS